MISFRTRHEDGEARPSGMGVSGGRPIALGAIELERAITIEKWKRALTAAKTDELLPSEHEALNHARRLIRECDGRGAVISAGSAAEIALSRALNARLASANEPSAVAILMDRTTLGRLPGLAKRFGVDCPPIEKLVKVRNDAVHRAVTPYLSDANELVEIAAAVVWMHSPLM
jgi:hypothetical protein